MNKRPRKDHSGEIFGYYKVLSFFEIKPGRNSYWLCECICGDIKPVALKSLKRGESKSCGCKKPELISENKTKYTTSTNLCYNRYKHSAKKKGREFTLSQEEFIFYTIKACHYCGSLPKNIQTNKNTKINPFIYNGLDRIDNTKGYTIDNIVPCCKICNSAKNDSTIEEWINYLDNLVDFRTRISYNIINETTT